MRVQELFEQELFEFQHSYLYHGTGPDEAMRILLSNRLLAKTEHLPNKLVFTRDNDQKDRYVKGVSFSRTPIMPRRWKSGDGVVFVLDERKLHQRHRVVPIDYYAHSTDRKRSEAEEFAIGTIDNLDQYLVAIEISQATYDDLVGEDEQYLSDQRLYDTLTEHPKLKIVGQRWDRLTGAVLRSPQIAESLSSPLDWRWKSKNTGYSVAEFEVGGNTYWVHLAGQFTVSIQFDLLGVGQKITGTGSAQKVFATVLDIVTTFIGRQNPSAFAFAAKRSHPSRVKLYRSLSKRLEPIAAADGYHLEIDEDDPKEVSFTFQKA